MTTAKAMRTRFDEAADLLGLDSCRGRNGPQKVGGSAEIDCVHWLWPLGKVVAGVDVAHWFTNEFDEQRRRNV